MSYSPEQLQHVLESGIPPRDPELAALSRLSRRLAYVASAGPSPAASQRMAARFEQLIDTRSRRWFGFLPVLPGSRNVLVQRLAAGAILVGLLGGAGSAATGVTPAEAAKGTVRFIASAVANLSPGEAVTGELQLTGADPAEAASNDPPGTADPGTAPQSPVPGAPDALAPGGTPANNGQPATPAPSASPSATPSPGAQPSRTPTPSATPGSGSGMVPPVFGPVPPESPTFSGGAPEPTPSPSSAATGTPTGTSTGAPTPSATPTPGQTSTPTPSPSPTPSATPTATPTSVGHGDDDDDEVEDDEHEDEEDDH